MCNSHLASQFNLERGTHFLHLETWSLKTPSYRFWRSEINYFKKDKDMKGNWVICATVNNLKSPELTSRRSIFNCCVVGLSRIICWLGQMWSSQAEKDFGLEEKDPPRTQTQAFQMWKIKHVLCASFYFFQIFLKFFCTGLSYKM